jgi:hypothetical protein
VAADVEHHGGARRRGHAVDQREALAKYGIPPGKDNDITCQPLKSAAIERFAAESLDCRDCSHRLLH